VEGLFHGLPLAVSVKRHDTADIDRVKTEKRETNFDRWTKTYRQLNFGSIWADSLVLIPMQQKI
jgi:hypothetical protein